ncbi:glycosyltransferase family 4 protein [Budviciaceae bacterium BWR-B9]|uniref:Glycosyltransferase family 4 protein n=1 Tax=Limnobaculum allomyrinae TaxID=2791986 RepID=A0ABS1IVJ7_9GAMM|nr:MULTISPECIES: glycosyltransferase family 4 protein [Limnobaculum]MBK5145712.1 glycosyltransferase family 4 protein [Limnobaculum allomyrinae]MBV7693754.1 glycosyltransferase family 4 protein [Limnobaculum sp. M2-1]
MNGKRSLINKILFITSSLQRGGPTNQLYELVSSNIFRESFNVEILSLSPLDINSSRSNDFKQLGLPVYSLNDNSHNYFVLKNKLYQFITENDYHTVISQGIRADISISLVHKKLSSKIYSILHNYIGPDYRYTYGYKSSLMTFLHVRALKKMNVICVSESVGHYVKHQYHLNTIAIRNGVSPSVPKIKSSHIDGDKIKLVYVGVLNDRKGVRELIDSFIKIERQDVELSIVGSGPLSDSLIYSDRRVIFYGQRNDIADILANSDIFVSNSKFEGLPMAVLEALSVGIPCLLSKIPPHQEVISLSKAFGSICDFNDTPAFSHLINESLGIHPDAIIDDFNRNLSSDVMAEQYKKILIS